MRGKNQNRKENRARRKRLRAPHPHPIFIVESLSGVIYLLLLPLARGAITALQGGFVAWLAGAWFDLFILFFILGAGVLRWWMTRYRCDERGLWLRCGVLFWRESFIPIENITTLALVDAFYLKPFGAVKLRAETPAGSGKRVDFALTVSGGEARRIFALRGGENRVDYLPRSYRPKWVYILTLSLITSNSFAGLLLTASFIRNLGEVVGAELSQRVAGTFGTLVRTLAFGIPPAAAGVAYLLLFGWLLAFAMNLFRHKDFEVRRDSDTLSIKGGIFTNREYSILVDRVSYVDIQQTVFTKILELQSVFIHAIGYGKDKDDILSVIPAASGEELRGSLSLLLPEFVPTQRVLRPNPGAIFKFIGDPAWPCVLIPLGSWLLGEIYPDWRGFLWFLGGMLSIPAYWFMAVRVLDFFSSGVSRAGEYFTLRYSSGFYLHTVIIPKEKITSIDLRQSILQRGDKKCDLLLFSYAEGRRRHHCKNLDLEKLREMFLED